jgi:hypothetical protein
MYLIGRPIPINSICGRSHAPMATFASAAAAASTPSLAYDTTSGIAIRRRLDFGAVAPGAPASPAHTRIRIPALYVAYLNRSGPGTICTSITGGQSCTDESSPWPWLAVGVGSLLGGAPWIVDLHGLRDAKPGRWESLGHVPKEFTAITFATQPGEYALAYHPKYKRVVRSAFRRPG